MNAADKGKILALVAGSSLPRRCALSHLGLAKSTYYRWLARQAEGGLKDRKGGSTLPWNKLQPEEEEKLLSLCRASPELSPRQLAFTLTDTRGTYVSESSVYRILKREGLIKPAEVTGFKAGKEYHRKTNGPNELWATDCAHLRVDMRNRISFAGVDPVTFEIINRYSRIGQKMLAVSVCWTLLDRRNQAGKGWLVSSVTA